MSFFPVGRTGKNVCPQSFRIPRNVTSLVLRSLGPKNGEDPVMVPGIKYNQVSVTVVVLVVPSGLASW